MAKRIVFASTFHIEEFRTEVDEVMWQIASLLKGPSASEEDWLQYCFISDEPRIADFLSDEVQLGQLRNGLKLPSLHMNDFICRAAGALREGRAETQRRIM